MQGDRRTGGQMVKIKKKRMNEIDAHLIQHHDQTSKRILIRTEWRIDELNVNDG
jgi:ribosomal protein S15P/S13E